MEEFYAEFREKRDYFWNLRWGGVDELSFFFFFCMYQSVFKYMETNVPTYYDLVTVSKELRLKMSIQQYTVPF